MPAAAILRIGVRLGPDRVVEVTGVGAVDCNQREVAQIAPACRTRRKGCLGFGNRSNREFGRDVMTGEGEKTNRTGVRGVSEPFDDASSRKAEPPSRELLDPYQFAIIGSTDILFRHTVLVAIAAVGRHDLSPQAAAVKYADGSGPHRTEHSIVPSLDLGLLQQVTQSRSAAPVGQ